MRVFIAADAESASRRAAAVIVKAIAIHPDLVIGLATGRTPEGLYRELVRAHLEDGVSFSRVTTFNLDEYVGLAEDDPASFRAQMQRQLFVHVDISRSAVHFPAVRGDLEATGIAYETRIVAAGGIDLQLLGLGANGHIGFNEPGGDLDSRTRLVRLSEETRRDNAAVFGRRPVPEQAVTMGVGTILEARRCLLLAFGPEKATAVQRSLEGPVTPDVPASALKTHADVQVFLDPGAASRLQLPDHYEWQPAIRG